MLKMEERIDGAKFLPGSVLFIYLGLIRQGE